MTDDIKACPHCGADLQGAPIPEQDRQYYGGATHFQRQLGIEIPGVYDGVLYYMCPDCGLGWPRFTGDSMLARSSARHAAEARRAS